MSEVLLSRLARALRGESPQSTSARRIASQVTTRDLHPTHGSHAIMQHAAQGVKQIASLNVRHADGSQGPIFCWGVPAFGWGKGEWQ